MQCGNNCHGRAATQSTMMTYEETLQYLYTSAPLFQQVGGAAYKEGLSTTRALDAHFNHPHTHYKTIHIAGTNGKGSCAHTLAAMLQRRGYKVGLYTSPHLVDFRERIRVNGELVSKEYVVDFVRDERSFFEPLHPSFFELTTALAFKYFADAEVDIAVIEVGLGGRLDCTNIIHPILSVITNISLDHTQLLGDTLAKIAAEKAGIMKENVPVVVGETNEETRPVFIEAAQRTGAPIFFAEDEPEVLSTQADEANCRIYKTRSFGTIEAELSGECQTKNANTLLCAYKRIKEQLGLTDDDLRYAFRHVCEDTGLQGRWQTLAESPITVCDTGHNTGGWQYLAHQLSQAVENHVRVHVVFGMAADKDVDCVLSMLPRKARFYWTRASVNRAMEPTCVKELAAKHGLTGDAYPDVPAAYEAAKANASVDDFIYIGGSCFVVADLLAYLQKGE